GSCGVRSKVDTVEPLPELERLAERQVAVERQALVEQCHLAGPPDRPCPRPQQPRENAQQARLAGTVGPCDLQRLALLQRERQPAEQQTLAAAAGEVRRGKARGFHGGPG